MTKVITGVGSGAVTAERRSSGLEWGPLAGLALVFALVSLADIGLAFFPVDFGNVEWEFATATQVLNNLPLAVVGIGLLGVAGVGRRTDSWVKGSAALAGFLIVVLLLVAVLFLKNIPVALRSVTDPILKQGLTESVVRSTVQLVGYLAALGWMVTRLRQFARA